jgi:nicotinic acid mononucleotide adenylyltransferase
VTTGVFPVSFNPPTVAHLAIADAARTQHGLDRVDLVVSRVPLGKEVVERPTLDERIDVLRRIGERLPWLGVVVSDLRLIADLAAGYDVVIMGADKWHQIHDVSFYDHSSAARDAALARLPRIAVVPRAGLDLPLDVPHDLALDVDPAHLDVSSTRAREGAHDLMAPEARDSGLWLR